MTTENEKYWEIRGLKYGTFFVKAKNEEEARELFSDGEHNDLVIWDDEPELFLDGEIVESDWSEDEIKIFFLANNGIMI